MGLSGKLAEPLDSRGQLTVGPMLAQMVSWARLKAQVRPTTD